MNPSIEAWSSNPLGDMIAVGEEGEEWTYEVTAYDKVRRPELESKRYSARQLRNGELLKAKVCDNELLARQQCRAWERVRSFLFEVSPFRPLVTITEIGRPLCDPDSPLADVPEVDYDAPLASLD